MGTETVIDRESLSAAVKRMQSEMQTFQNATKTFTSEMFNYMDGCNSDFIVAYKKPLTIMKQTKLNKLDGQMCTYIQNTEKLKKIFEETDASIQKEIQKKGK